MKTPPKPRGTASGQPETEMAKLKQLWRGMSDEARAYWQELLASAAMRTEIRRQLLAKLNIDLRYDQQLSTFRIWELEQRDRDLEAARQMEDERRLRELHPDWSLERARDTVLKNSYTRALASGDFALAMTTLQKDTHVRAFALSREKHQFNAAQKSLAVLPQLRAISASTLSDEEKIDAARRALFGDVLAESHPGEAKS